ADVFSANRCEYCPRPRFSSHLATCCIAAAAPVYRASSARIGEFILQTRKIQNEWHERPAAETYRLRCAWTSSMRRSSKLAAVVLRAAHCGRGIGFAGHPTPKIGGRFCPDFCPRADRLCSRMPRFTHDGVQITFLDEGEGEPIVLVHGFASNKEVNWVFPG